MSHHWLLATALLAVAAGAAAQDGPIAYAPDIVGADRLFLVALRVPTDAPEIDPTAPGEVALLDQTRPPFKDEIRKFYFRALRPAKKVEIGFALPGGPVAVPLEIWSFEDLRQYRTLKGLQLPRRWPLGSELPELKEAQVFPTGAESKTPDGKAAGGILDLTDEAVWDMQPDSTIPRWHWTNLPLGCPVHGTDIYRKQAYYPWGMNSETPWDWKITCPVGGEKYPSNDFGAGDMTGGLFPDDAIGGGYVQNGNHYSFLAELSQFYCRRMMTVAPDSAAAYAATGDRRYVHKALVALCRLAVEYAYLATMTHHRHHNTVAQVEKLGQGRFGDTPDLAASGFTTYPIEQPANQAAQALAYDRIFPAIDKDEQIIPFLRKKGFAVKTHEDVRRFIEENLFAVWMQGSMDGACASNEPFSQYGFTRMAEVLNYKRGDDFLDFLYRGKAYEFTPMSIFMPNTFFRDGAPYESTGGYNSMHLEGLVPIVESVERMRQRRPDVYPESRFSGFYRARRYRHIFDFALDTVTIDRSYPQIGDGGSWPVYSKLPRIVAQYGGAGDFEHAYRMFQDPKFAWALTKIPGWKPSDGFPWTQERIEAEAAKWPEDWNDKSSLHDGYGIAILRGGKENDKRAFWMNYGHNRSHSQDDMLDFGLQGYEGIFLSHMGYPRNWGYWEYAWSSHYGARQFPYTSMTAQAQIFADAGPAHVAEALAKSYSDRSGEGKDIEISEDSWQRRLIALVDVGPDRFYAVDFYRIAGGKEHWWPFHGPEGEFKAEGIRLTPQGKGTLAGPDVPYGDPGWLKANGCSYGTYGWSGLMFPFAHLYNVEKGKTPADGWQADWKLKNGAGMRLRLTLLGGEGTETNLCDGTSPAGGNPYELKWIMLHSTGEAPLKTQLLNIIEPYRNTPIIRKARRLKLTGADETGFRAEGLLLNLDDRTDALFASADPQAVREVEGEFRFAGKFGFWSEKNGVPVAVSLVGGTQLHKGDIGITLPAAEYRARIGKVDRKTDTITVFPAPPVPEALVGSYLFIANSSRRVACKVLSVKKARGGAEIRLDTDSHIGTGQVTGTADFRVQTDTPFPLQGYRYYHGSRLVNAARTAEYPLIEVKNESAALINSGAAPDAKADRLAAEFPRGSWFDVYDYGVGDEVIYPHRASLTLAGPNAYTVVSSAKATVKLPAGARKGR